MDPIKAALRNPVAVAAVVALLVLFGAIAALGLPLQLFPDVERPQMSVATDTAARSQSWTTPKVDIGCTTSARSSARPTPNTATTATTAAVAALSGLTDMVAITLSTSRLDSSLPTASRQSALLQTR